MRSARLQVQIADLPDTPDLALVTLGAAQVNGVIEQCGERRIPVALVVAAGYSEAGEAGAAAEAELTQDGAGLRASRSSAPIAWAWSRRTAGSTPSASWSCGRRRAA